METEMRYKLVSNDDGSWRVVDTETDGPAELEMNGGMRLEELPYDEALAWWRLLNRIIGTVVH